MKLEVDGVERDLDEEKLERLVRHERGVESGEKEVTEPTEVSLYSGLKRVISSVIPGSLPPRKTAVITDIDVSSYDHGADGIKFEVKNQGEISQFELRTTEERYANLLGYLGYEHSDVLDLPGEEIPVSFDDRGRARIDVPNNTATWAVLYFQFIRGLVRFGVLESNRVSKYTTRYWFTHKTIIAAGLGQLGVVFLLFGMPQHGAGFVGFLHFMLLCLSVAVGFFMSVWLLIETVMWACSGIESAREDFQWPV